MILQDMWRKSLITNSDPTRKNIYSSKYSYSISTFNESYLVPSRRKSETKVPSPFSGLRNSIILLIQAWFAYKNVLLNKLSWDKKYQF